jgi:hypothetical protein
LQLTEKEKQAMRADLEKSGILAKLPKAKAAA